MNWTIIITYLVGVFIIMFVESFCIERIKKWSAHNPEPSIYFLAIIWPVVIPIAILSILILLPIIGGRKLRNYINRKDVDKNCGIVVDDNINIR